MNELVEAVQATVRREVAQVLRQAADAIDGDGQAVARQLGRQASRRLSDTELVRRREVAKAAEKTEDFVRLWARGAKRGRPQGVGFRHQQVLDLLRKYPEGLGGSDVAKRCGMQGTQVYGVLKRLQRDGDVEKRGRVYVAV